MQKKTKLSYINQHIKKSYRLLYWLNKFKTILIASKTLPSFMYWTDGAWYKLIIFIENHFTVIVTS